MGFFDTLGGFVDNTLGTDFTGQGGPARARRAQEGASKDAANALAQGYEDQKNYLNPYVNDATGARESLRLGNFVNPQNIQSNPAYQFRLNEGLKGVQASAAARGGLNSGRTLKELTRFGQGLASTEYDNEYNRQYQRLSDLVNRGFNASTNLGSSTGQYHANLANVLTGRGDAQGASYIAQANQNAAFFDRLTNNVKEGAKYAAQTSDEREKINIKPVDKEDLKEMKSYLKAYAFNYKNDELGKGDWIGVMAQDLEKSKLGKLLVEENNGVKVININKLLSLFLAYMAEGEA